MPRIRIPLVLVIALTLIVPLAVVLAVRRWDEVRFDADWRPRISVTIPSRGTVEYGWMPDGGIFVGSFSTYLHWRRTDGSRRYYRMIDGGDPLDDRVTIRLASKGEGLWVEAQGEIVSALEFDTGRFWDQNQLPGFNSEPNSAAIQAWPRWGARPGSKQLYPATIVPAPSR